MSGIELRSPRGAADSNGSRWRRAAVCVAAVVACGLLVSPAYADQWYAADMHVHSVAVSGDANQDLGVMSLAAKQDGLNAVFLTDHSMGGNLPIAQAVANHIVFDPSKGMTFWKTAKYMTPTSQTNAITASPTGAQALHLAATASGYGETFIWQKRGPDLRSGDLILKFSVYPVRIDSGSGVYVSVGIGGDATLGAVPGSACDSSSTTGGRPPNGYTTAAGVISPYKYDRLVWQLGTPVTPSSNPSARVITNNLPYTLGQWNSYVIDVSNGHTTWNGSTVTGVGNGIQDIPAVDQPMSYNALSQLKLTAAGNGGTANAYFGTYNLDASNAVQNGDEFVYRNSIVHTYDSSTFKVFPGLEAGTGSHVSRFNYDITSPTQWHAYSSGIDSIAETQATGYPTQIDHPGLPGGISQTALESNLGYGSDLMEAVPRGGNEIMLNEWDDLLKQNVPILGTWSTDAHRTEALGLATYIYAPSLAFDPLIRALWEGRAFMANAGFAGRLAFNLDGSSAPYPGRYPVYVPQGPVTENVHLSISGGVPTGATVRWIQNGSVLRTDSTSGSTYAKTVPISVSGSFAYVRAELRSSAGALLAMTEPIFFDTAPSLPAGTSLHVDGVTTADGKGYTRTMTKGVTQVSYDATNGLKLTLANLPGSLVETEAVTGSTPGGVTVDGTAAPAAATLAAFDGATTTTWFYDATAHILHLKTIEGSTGSSSAVVRFGVAADGQPPTTPSGVTAAASSPTSAHVSWRASTDDTGVAGYTVYRNGAQAAKLGASTLSFDDTTLAPSTTYTYTVDAFDKAGNHSAQSAPVTVKTPAANHPPTAADVALTTPTNVAATWVPSVADADNDTLTCAIGTPPAHGTASVRADCSQGSYSANGGYVGPDPFTYTVSDGTASATATVSVTVAARQGNTAPSATAVTASTMQHVAVVLTLAATDPDGDCPLTFTPTLPARGTLTAVTGVTCASGHASAQITYTPNRPLVGTDAFTYTVRDPLGASSRAATVTITVLADHAPVASAVAASTLQATSVDITLAATDPDGDCPLTFTPGLPGRGSVTAPTRVTCASGTATAHVTYTPNRPVIGTDQFTYTVQDPTGTSSPAAAVTITVAAVPPSRPPVASDLSATTMKHVPVTLSLAATDPDGDCPLAFTPTLPGRGTLTAVTNVTCTAGKAGAQITYTPNAPFVGIDHFTYTVRDPSGATSTAATATITVRASQPPVVTAASASTLQHTPVTIPLSASDPDGDCPLTFTPTLPSRGGLSAVTNVTCSAGKATAQITYTPNAPFFGTDQFTYTAHDPSGATSAPAAVTINVTHVVFSDGFESGTFAAWTAMAGLVAERTTVGSGLFAAEGVTTNGNAWAKRTLPATYPELTARVRVRIHSRAAGSPLTIVTFRTAADAPIASVYLDGLGHLSTRNLVTGATSTSATTISPDVWHALNLHVKVNGFAGSEDVSLDGTGVPTLSASSVDLGTTPIGEVQLGEPAAGSSFDAFFDDVVVTAP